MTVGLFVPCYIDQFYPEVAVATLRLLEKMGCDVVYPTEQTCCGQPMADAGYERESTGWHDETLWLVRRKRDAAAASVPEWEELRERASQIKAHTLSHIDVYLEQFEAQATANGVLVHWACDAAEHNEIVHRILERHGVRHLVKSKSMLSEECGLNPYLEDRGIEVVNTGLRERIVQLAGEPPSHVVIPAFHKKKEEVGRHVR